MTKQRLSRSLLAVGLCSFSAGFCSAASWPTYCGDAGRTSYTAEQPPGKLHLSWTYKPAHPPMRAWPTDNLMDFDRGIQVVADEERIYFGSASDDKIYALDAGSGREAWTFFTGGPVRFAPILHKDRLFAASDDGHPYCLAAKDGKLLWRKRGFPKKRMLLGNGRMISKWPARGGPVVVDDVVYFGAGMFPTDGITISALNADTGEVVWVNDKSGAIGAEDPNKAPFHRSGIASQGYLAAAGDRLYVPTGRSLPATLDRTDGKLIKFKRAYRAGNPRIRAFDSLMINSGLIFNASNETLTGLNASSVLAATPELVFTIGYCTLLAIDRAKPFTETIVGAKKKKVHKWNKKWSIRCNHKTATALLAAGKTLFIAHHKYVAAIDTETRKQTWRADVTGRPVGLAFAAGRLYVSIEGGPIHCFAAKAGTPTVIETKRKASSSAGKSKYAAAAEEVLKKTGVTEGYCLDLGCGEGELAFELAKRSRLQVIAMDKDPAKVEAARRKLDAAGLYGVRVTILQGDPARSELPNYFADLIVSGNAVAGGVVPPKEARRCTRPYGGITCFGKPGSMKLTTRGPLKGAGDWTHQYADAANTVCSDDTLVKGALSVLWFDMHGQHRPNRHGRAPAPLFADGRLFVQGVDDVRAYSAYNGRRLWTLPLKEVGEIYDRAHLGGVAVTASNFCLWKNTVFVHNRAKCLRVDAATGKVTGEFNAPPDKDGKPGTWGYLACDDGILFGTVADTEFATRSPYFHQWNKAMAGLFKESRALFAMDAKTGEVKWKYQAEKSIRHNAIAVGAGTVYLIDRATTSADRINYVHKQGEPQPEHPHGTLLALDAATGKLKWKQTEKIYGTLLALSTKHDALLMGYQTAYNYRLPSEKKGSFAVFRASSGKLLHDTQSPYFRNRPVINDQTIYGPPYPYDLLTGKCNRSWRFRAGPSGKSCSTPAGGKYILTFRNSTLGYVDVTENLTARFLSGVRPGCWINAIPAGGLVLMPDYSAHCVCTYQFKTSLALETAGNTGLQ